MWDRTLHLSNPLSSPPPHTPHMLPLRGYTITGIIAFSLAEGEKLLDPGTDILHLWSAASAIGEDFIWMQRQRSSLLFGGQNWFISLPHYRFRARMIWRNGWLEKWTLGGMDTLEQLSDLPVHTPPNHHDLKMDVLPKTFLQIILAANWLIRYSNMSPPKAATTFAFSSV